MANNSPWHNWYGRKAWKVKRAAQLASEPLCRKCKESKTLTAATVADHIVPHNGDWELFIGGELQSLCKTHHDEKTARGPEAGAAKTTKGFKGCDANGVPTDPAHHWH